MGKLPELSEESFNPISSDKIKTLIDTALGKIKADLVVSHADLVNVYSGELQKNQSVAIKGDRIAFVGEKAEHIIGPDTRVIDAAGKVLIPGLIDSHTHLMAMCQADEFLKYAITGGTTAIVSETINFVLPLGYDNGVRQFLKATENQPVKIFATVAPALSLSPSSRMNILSPEKLRRLLRQNRVVGLGETSWPFILQDEGEITSLHVETLKAGKQLEGHAAGARGNNLQAYAASGISSCHEPTTVEEVMERLRLGLHAMIREGDVRRDLEAIAAIKDKPIDFRRLVLCTDGLGPKYVMKRGYMESLVQKAIDLGFNPVVAIQMATLNAAEHFRIDSIIGGIAPGKCADMAILPDLRTIRAEMVISNGRIIAERGQLLAPPRKHIFPKSVLSSVHIPRKLKPADFQVRAKGEDVPVTVRVINLVNGALTREEQIIMTSENGLLMADTERDILKAAFIDRTNSPGKMFTGFVKGFNLRKGAIATTVSMGLSGITVVGGKDEDLAGAVNRVVALQGGAVVYAEGKVLSELPLPIAGFVSDLPMETVLQRFEGFRQSAARLETSLRDVHSAIASLSTTVIPSLRLCESGLMDIRKGVLVDLIV